MLKIWSKEVNWMSFNGFVIKRAYLNKGLVFESRVEFFTDRKYKKTDNKIFLSYEKYVRLNNGPFLVKIGDYPEIEFEGMNRYNGFKIMLNKNSEGTKKFGDYDWFPEVLEAGTKVLVKFK